MIAQGMWDRGGRKRMMEKSFLSPIERSIILIPRERGEDGKRPGEFIWLPFSPHIKRLSLKNIILDNLLLSF